MWAETDSTLSKSGIGNIIIIKGLARDINNLALYRTFSHFREILSSRVVWDSKGELKGYGFIHYATLEAVELAMKKLNDGALLNGHLVSVCHFKKYEKHQAEYKSNSNPPQNKDLSKTCRKAWAVRGWAPCFFCFWRWRSLIFVTYSSLNDAVIATSVMNGYIVTYISPWCKI